MYGVVASQLAIDLDSPAFRVISSIVLVVVVINWLYLVYNTLVRIWTGEWFLKEALEEMREKKREDGGSEEARAQSMSGTRVEV
jgi:hypothetical protein